MCWTHLIKLRIHESGFHRFCSPIFLNLSSWKKTLVNFSLFFFELWVDDLKMIQNIGRIGSSLIWWGHNQIILYSKIYSFWNSLASNPKKRSISDILNSSFNKEIRTLKQDNGKKKPSNQYPKKDFAYKLYKLRKERVQKVCKKYKMKVDEPSPEIFSSILCFSKYEVSAI